MSLYRIADVIERKGETVTIWHNTPGAVGSYGQRAQAWAALSPTEKMLFQSLISRRMGFKPINLESGRFTDVDKAAYAKYNSAVQKDDKIVDANSDEWFVQYVEKILIGGTTQYIMLLLSKFEGA